MALSGNIFIFDSSVVKGFKLNAPSEPIYSWQVPAGLPGSLDLAGLWCSEGPEASPSTSWKVLFCFPHMWWICMAASRSATRSRSCWAKWALSCLISNWKERREKNKNKSTTRDTSEFTLLHPSAIKWTCDPVLGAAICVHTMNVPPPCMICTDFWHYVYTDPVVPWPHTGD